MNGQRFVQEEIPLVYRRWYLSPYVLVLGMFVLWMVFLDSGGFLAWFQQYREVRRLEAQIQVLERKTRQLRQAIEAFSHKEEEYGRLVLNLVREGEEIFLLPGAKHPGTFWTPVFVIENGGGEGKAAQQWDGAPVGKRE